MVGIEAHGVLRYEVFPFYSYPLKQRSYQVAGRHNERRVVNLAKFEGLRFLRFIISAGAG